MKHSRALFAVPLAACLFSGCASIDSGPRQDGTLTSPSHEAPILREPTEEPPSSPVPPPPVPTPTAETPVPEAPDEPPKRDVPVAETPSPIPPPAPKPASPPKQAESRPVPRPAAPPQAAEDAPASGSLQEFNELHDRGYISDELFEALKGSMPHPGMDGQ